MTTMGGSLNVILFMLCLCITSSQSTEKPDVVSSIGEGDIGTTTNSIDVPNTTNSDIPSVNITKELSTPSNNTNNIHAPATTIGAIPSVNVTKEPSSPSNNTNSRQDKPNNVVNKSGDSNESDATSSYLSYYSNNETINIICQEGPEAGSISNGSCNCGDEQYFYGDRCEYVNLTSAADINTSKRVMEVIWNNTSPNFTREYSFIYRESTDDLTPDGDPKLHPVILKTGAGYFYAWLTSLKSGEVNYVVCIIENTVAHVIANNASYWSRLNYTAQDDCVTIETQLNVSREITMVAIFVAAGMGIILIIIFSANFCVGKKPKGKVEVKEKPSVRRANEIILSRKL